MDDKRFLKINTEIDLLIDFKSSRLHKLNFDRFECGFSIKVFKNFFFLIIYWITNLF